METKLSSSQKGALVENYIANIIMIYSNGLLTVSKPIIDDDGIDIIINKKGEFKTIFCQIKSRFTKNKNNCQFQIRKNTFNSHDSFYIICVFFSENKNKINIIWFIPSNIIEKQPDNENDESFVVAPSILINTKDKWSSFKIKEEELINKIYNYL